MRKIFFISTIICAFFISSKAKSVSMDDLSGLNLPIFGSGHILYVCYLHGNQNPFAIVSASVVCDVDLLSTNQQSNILSSKNIIYVTNKANIEWLVSPSHNNQHYDGDPDCYNRKTLRTTQPGW